MKPENKFANLNLRKKAIANLSDNNLSLIIGGKNQATTQEGFTSVLGCNSQYCCPTLSN